MYIEGELPNVVTSGNGNGAWGDDWAWIIILALVFGWGGNGFGYGSGSGAAENYVLASDFATLQRQIDSGIASLERKGDAINTGLCDGFYAMNTSLLTGFGGVNQNIMQNGYETRSAISGISSQLAACCCEIQKELLENRYVSAQQVCDIKTAMATNTRDIIDSQREGTAAILNFLTGEKISALQAKNAELSAQISQAGQTATLLQAINRTPIPAYTVPNPYCCYGTSYGCGCGSTGCCSTL